MTYRDIDPNIAGIYIFRNNINGKCYVGQGISLRKRIKHHFSNIRTQRYDLPLYRAINKYGLHNFTIDILESFVPNNISNEQLIKKLDKLEIEYIEKYDSYHNGYNCTVGGDYGVLGLKMTDAQKKNVSKAVKENIAKGIIGKRVYMYNFKEKYYIYAWTIKDAANITKLSRSNISKLCNNSYINPYCKNFVAAYSKEKLEELIRESNDFLKEIEKNTHKSNFWYKGMISLNKGKKMTEFQKLKIKKALQKNYVLQFDLNGKFLKKFDNTEDAAKSVNGRIDTIRCACNGKQKTAYKYIWRYELKAA